MTGDELLEELGRRLASGELSAAQVQRVIAAHDAARGTASADTPRPDSSTRTALVTRLLFLIGGVFIFIGVAYLVSQLWDDLNSASRIAITLGTGLVFAGAGSWLLERDPQRETGNVFHAVGGLMTPGGALVVLEETGIGLDAAWPITLAIAAVFAFYLALAWLHRRAVLSFFCFVNGAALAWLLTDALAPHAPMAVYDYLTLCIGVSFIIFAHLFRDHWNEKLVPLLLFFGPVGLYGGAFARAPDSLMMEVLFPVLALGGMVLSVNLLRSRLALVISTLALIAYIIYFTEEYFVDSIGWPVALILLGFAVIGIGYLSVNLNRRYLKP